jgi:DNA-directed RNA polymerase sigma subunit (sigma70/sigma32)
MQREGATFEEIGAALGVSKQAAKSIYDGAMVKLKRHIRLHPEKAEALWNFLEGSPDPKGYGKYTEVE